MSIWPLTSSSSARAALQERVAFGPPRLRLALLRTAAREPLRQTCRSGATSDTVVPDGAVVGVDVQRRQQLGAGGAARRFRRSEPIARREEVGARVVGARQRVLDRQVVERRERHLVGQRELLPRRQADGPRQLQLRLLEVVLRDDEALALVLDLDLGAQDVDAGDQPRGLEVGRLLEERLRGVLLRVRDVDPARGGHRFEVEIDRDQHDEVARRLDAARLGALVERGGAVVVERAQVDDRLREADPRVEDVERSDDRRVRLEAEDREVDDRPVLAEGAGETLGSRSSSARQRAPCAWVTLDSCSSRPRLYWRPRVTASLSDSASGCGDGGPCGGGAAEKRVGRRLRAGGGRAEGQESEQERSFARS